MRYLRATFAAFALVLTGLSQAATLTLGNNWDSFQNGTATYSAGPLTVTVRGTGGSLFYNGTTTLGARDFLGVGSNIFNGAVGYHEGLVVGFSEDVRLTSIGLSQWENGWETARLSFGNDGVILAGSHRQEGPFGTRDYWSFGPGLSLNEFKLRPHSGLPAFYLFEIGYELVGPAEVPLPAAAWLFGSAILGVVIVGRRKAHQRLPVLE